MSGRAPYSVRRVYRGDGVVIYITSEAYQAIEKSIGGSPSFHFKPETECEVTISTTPNAVIKFKSPVSEFFIFETPNEYGHFKMMSALRDALNTFLEYSHTPAEALEAEEVGS